MNNGKFGCQICKQEGVKLNLSRVYPYERNLRLRTEDEIIAHALQAEESKLKVCGVKEPTILSKIVYKFITSTGIDIMHAVFEGIAKKLIYYWFDNSYATEDFSISKFKHIICDRMESLQPPEFVQRCPRSFDDLKYWKASELINWSFYYSIPILRNILPDVYYEHYKLLVLGVFYYSKKKLTMA